MRRTGTYRMYLKAKDDTTMIFLEIGLDNVHCMPRLVRTALLSHWNVFNCILINKQQKVSHMSFYPSYQSKTIPCFLNTALLPRVFSAFPSESCLQTHLSQQKSIRSRQIRCFKKSSLLRSFCHSCVFSNTVTTAIKPQLTSVNKDWTIRAFFHFKIKFIFKALDKTVTVTS